MQMKRIRRHSYILIAKNAHENIYDVTIIIMLIAKMQMKTYMTSQYHMLIAKYASENNTMSQLYAHC